MSSVAEGCRLDFGNRSRRRPVADLQVKHATNAKGRRAHMVRRRRSSVNNNSSNRGNRSRSRGSAAAQLANSSAGRCRGAASRKVEIENNQRKRRSQPRDSGRETPEAVLFSSRFDLRCPQRNGFRCSGVCAKRRPIQMNSAGDSVCVKRRALGPSAPTTIQTLQQFGDLNGVQRGPLSS